MQDRLSDLLDTNVIKGDNDAASKDVVIELCDMPQKSEIDDCMRPYVGLRESIAKIERHCETINELKHRSNKEVKDDVQKAILQELDRTMLATKREARGIKQGLDALMQSNAKYEANHVGSTSAQMRKNMLSTHCRQFQDVMSEFSTASEAFRLALKQRIARQARIVQEDISDDQIEDMIEGDNPTAIFQQAMMQADDSLVDAVKDIEDQHKGMQQIEQGVKEIQELFNDMAVLVDMQQETLDVIERNVQDTAKYTHNAEKNLVQAEIYQKQSRKAQCWIMLVVAIICGIVLFFLFG